MSRVRENRTHGSMGGGWKRNTTRVTAPAPDPPLHEFETWVIACAQNRPDVLGDVDTARRLQAVADEFGGDVELVNEGPDTAPSKRVAAAWPGFQKTIDGVDAIREAGLRHVGSCCPALQAWLDELVAPIA